VRDVSQISDRLSGARLTRMVLLGNGPICSGSMLAEHRLNRSTHPQSFGRERHPEERFLTHNPEDRRCPEPREIDIYPPGAIVERPSMMELRWPMRTFKVKFPRTLCDPALHTPYVDNVIKTILELAFFNLSLVSTSTEITFIVSTFCFLIRLSQHKGDLFRPMRGTRNLGDYFDAAILEV